MKIFTNRKAYKMPLLIISLVVSQFTVVLFAADVSHSSVGFVEMPESSNSEWILKSPYGSEKAWGRPEMIRHLWLVCTEWNRRYPDRPKIRIGDISKPNGGTFPPHGTHRVGLAVDVKTKPQNIVDVNFTQQQQVIDLAELFYTFGAVLIIYGNNYEFDSLPIVVSDSGHNNHFHVVINPENVPNAGDWVIMPKVDLDHNNLHNQQDIVSVLISCELIGVTTADNNRWSTTLPTNLNNITFQLKNISSSNPSMTAYENMKPQSGMVKKQMTLRKNQKYLWRIIITTPSQKQMLSKWFLLDTSGPNPELGIHNEKGIISLPIHFTVLTCKPKANKRITKEYLTNEIDELNKESIKLKFPYKPAFSLRSFCNANYVKQSDSSMSLLIDTRREYEKEKWRTLVESCHNSRIVNPSAINVFIYDAYSRNNGFSSKSTWLQRNCNRPYIFLDWQRSLNCDLFSFILKDPQFVIRYISDSPRLLKSFP